MSGPSKLQYVTVEDYLASEESSPVRREYVDGRVFAMTGVTRRHNVIAGNIHSILRAHVRGGPCRAYVSDVKARVKTANSFYYPDVMVACDQHDDRSLFTSSPVLIVEVLSRSTATIDRREKVLAYRQIESLREYLIVHQRKKRVELHCKNDQGGWDVVEYGPGTELVLQSIPTGPLTLSMEAIYEDVTWPRESEWKVREETESEEEDEEDEVGDLEW